MAEYILRYHRHHIPSGTAHPALRTYYAASASMARAKLLDDVNEWNRQADLYASREGNTLMWHYHVPADYLEKAK